MNRTVTIDELAATVAQFTQSEQAGVLTFIRETFMLASERLLQGEAVEIPHLGTFMAVDSTLLFRPDEELAQEINAPFSAFTAVEISDPAFLEPEPEQAPGAENTTAEPAPDEEAGTPDGTEAEIPVTEEDTPELTEAKEPEEQEPADTVDTPQLTATATTTTATQWIMPLMLAVLCLTVGFVMGRLTAPAPPPVYLTAPVTESSPIDTDTAGTDISKGVPPAAHYSEPAHQATTDTIRPGRFLTTMAREHYGQMEYWVYIYRENSDRLGNPDRLPSGMTVTIPSAEKYGLTEGDSIKIAEAKRMAADIYKNR